MIYCFHGLLVKWSRRRPLTAKTGVRLPYGSPQQNKTKSPRSLLSWGLCYFKVFITTIEYNMQKRYHHLAIPLFFVLRIYPWGFFVLQFNFINLMRVVRWRHFNSVSCKFFEFDRCFGTINDGTKEIQPFRQFHF